MKLARVRRPGTLEEIRSWILESRPPGSTVNLDGTYHALVVPELGRVAAVALKRLSWCMTEVKHLVVTPAARRQGYGRATLRLALEKVRTPLAIATVREDNPASLALFESERFAVAQVFQTSRGRVTAWIKALPPRSEAAPPASAEAPPRID